MIVMKWGELMKKLLLAMLAAMIVTSGCASTRELSDAVIQERKSGKQGVTREYQVSANQAWEITDAVFRWEKTDEVVKNLDENYAITSSGMKMAIFGSVLGVWIEPLDRNSTRLTVLSKNRNDRFVLTGLTPNHFLERFDQGVDIVRRGGQLPVMPPETR